MCLLTQYNSGVQPSMVMHWKTVMQAKMMLSNEVIPKFGPCPGFYQIVLDISYIECIGFRKKHDKHLPFLKANRFRGVANISSSGGVFRWVCVARHNSSSSVLHYFVCKEELSEVPTGACQIKILTYKGKF